MIGRKENFLILEKELIDAFIRIYFFFYFTLDIALDYSNRREERIFIFFPKYPVQWKRYVSWKKISLISPWI